MTLRSRLEEYIAAAFTGIWIQSHEHADALAEVGRLCRDRKWSSAFWDVDRGLQVASASGQAAAWGSQSELDKLLQAYTVEKALAEARRAGHSVAERRLEDGSIKLTIQVGAGTGGAYAGIGGAV